jgi:hypothetical protein
MSRLFTPLDFDEPAPSAVEGLSRVVTMWTSLGRLMGPDRSCRAAVSKLLPWLAARRTESRQGRPATPRETGEARRGCGLRECHSLPAPYLDPYLDSSLPPTCSPGRRW